MNIQTSNGDYIAKAQFGIFSNSGGWDVNPAASLFAISGSTSLAIFSLSTYLSTHT
jgi:hypothetical protein